MKRIKVKDILALRGAIKALDKSTSQRMVEANLQFLWDRYVVHPARKMKGP